MCRRIKLTLEYDGTPYCGWQRIKEGPSVQAELEKALQEITGEKIEIFAAGRTDKGVHALGQVVHFDTVGDRKLINFLDGLNATTSQNIAVIKVEEVESDFHSRFSAVRRRYKFLVFNRRHIRPTLYKKVTLVRKSLDFEDMQEAAELLPQGEGDWSAFRSSECQSKTPMVFIDEIALYKAEKDLIVLEIQGNHFLHHMVRIIMGTLVEVGLGKREAKSMLELFENKDRRQAGFTIEPEGLYLEEILYKPHVVLGVCPKQNNSVIPAEAGI